MITWPIFSISATTFDLTSLLYRSILEAVTADCDPLFLPDQAQVRQFF